MSKKRYNLFDLFSTRREEGSDASPGESAPYEPHPRRGGRRDNLSQGGRFRSSLTIIGVLLALSLIVRLCGGPKRPLRAPVGRSLDTLELRGIFEGWLKGYTDTVQVLDYDIVNCTFDKQTGMINNGKYDRAEAMMLLFENMEELIADGPERLHYEQKQVREKLKIIGKPQNAKDSLTVAVTREKDKMLKMLLGTLTEEDFKTYLQARKTQTQNELDSLSQRPGWFIRAKAVFSDSTAVTIDYLQTAEDTLIIPLNIRNL